VLTTSRSETELDNIDKKLVSILQKNGRTSLSEIGKDLGMSHVAVSKRLDKLVQSELVKVTAGVNAEYLDAKVLFMGLETEDMEEPGVRRSESWFGNAPIAPKYLQIDLAPGTMGSSVSPCGRDCGTCKRYKAEKCVGCPPTDVYKGKLWAAPNKSKKKRKKSKG
jgi:DNA-binding Lrp family transcriptional regulator